MKMDTHEQSPLLLQRPKRIEIRSEQGVRALFDNKQRTLLSPFFLEPISIAAAAEAADSLPSTMLQFVRRMTKFGILFRADEARRNGRRVHRFTTTADEFFVAIDAAEDVLLLPEKRFQQLYNEALSAEVIRYHYEVQPIGAVIRCLPNGVVELNGELGSGTWAPGNNGPNILFEWSMLKLDEADALSFQRELAGLIRTYRTLPFGDKAFYFGLHFAPVPNNHPPRLFVNTPHPSERRKH